MRLRIATFNIENLDIGSKGPPLEARIPTLQAQLRRLDADILCLQEVNGQKLSGEKVRRLQALDLLLHGTGYEKFLRAHTVREETGGAFDTHNLVTLSRFPIAEIAQVRHHHVSPGGAGGRRALGAAFVADRHRCARPRSPACDQSSSARPSGVAGSRRQAISADLARHLIVGRRLLHRRTQAVRSGARSTAIRKGMRRSSSAAISTPR
jgi:hypothetical protein